MLIRSVQIIFISFWLVTIGLLVKSVFWPSESGMVEIDPRRPLQTLLEWSDSARFKLYQDNREIGVVSLSASKFTEKRPARLTMNVNFNGEVQQPIHGSVATIRSDFKSDLSFESGAVVVRLPANGLIAKISTDANQKLEAEVTVDGKSIFTYQKSDSDSDQINPVLMGMVNSNPMLANLMEASEGLEQNLSIRSYHGIYRFKKRRLPVFLIKIATPNNAQEMRIFLSKPGDPLLVETNFGIYAISELFLSFESTGLDR